MNTDQTINLFDVGCLINLKIGRWSGRKMLTRSDLVGVGYDPDKLPDDIVNLGRKLMVPKSELQSLAQIEQKARQLLEKWSVPFGVANSHFVPAKMLPTIEQQLKEFKDEFFARVDSFIARFDDLVKTVREKHPEFWDKCLKGHYPQNPQALRKKFKFKWFIFKIAGLGSMQETDVEGIIAQQKIQDEKQAELRKQMQDEVSQFVGEYVASMRSETIRFCELMSARINGKPFGDEPESKRLTPKSISCFRKYVDRFKSMNIFGDQEIEKMLTEFKNTFLDSGISPKDFESATVKDSVTKALETIRSKAAIEGQSSSKFIGELKRQVVL